MDIIVTDKEILSQISVATTTEEVLELDLENRLKAACETAWVKGCGLAAIQIGVPLRFAWFRWGPEHFTLLNPRIIERKGKIKKSVEGCLSIPNMWVKDVPRHNKIVYESHGVRHTAKGDLARIIQHEIDHMDGVDIRRFKK